MSLSNEGRFGLVSRSSTMSDVEHFTRPSFTGFMTIGGNSPIGRESPTRNANWSPLGKGFGSPPMPQKLFKSFTPEVVVAPRPQVTLATFSALSAAFSSSISAVEKEIEGYKDAIAAIQDRRECQGRVYEMEKEVRKSERRLKRLSYQSSRVEELADAYALQCRLRDGVRSMAAAFSASSGRETTTALANVKAGYREVNGILLAIEAELQEFMGSFRVAMEGLQGFSRLCPGDVFSITLKHGNQKWKTRGRVTKDLGQEWDFPHATFKALLGHPLYIKACEVKTLGKTVLLGSKFCDVLDLLAHGPHLMTVNLNPTGSLKMALLFRWCPLELVSGDSCSGPPSLRSLSTVSSCHSSDSTSSSSSPSRKRRLSEILPQLSSTDVVDKPCDSPWGIGESSWKESSLSGKAARLNETNFSFLSYKFPHPELEEKMDGGISLVDSHSLFHNLQTLKNGLEDVQGQFPQLENLQQNLYKIIDYTNGSQTGSDLSLNVESALEAFDFLDNVDEFQETNFRLNKTDDPKMTARTTDSGISSLGVSSRSPSPIFQGNSSVSACLQLHVDICNKLVESLGSFGPLKERETRGICRLEEEGRIIGMILSKDFETLLKKLPNQLQAAWLASGEGILANGESVATSLQISLAPHVIRPRRIVARIQGNKDFSPNGQISVFQFASFFLSIGSSTYNDILRHLTSEEMLNELLEQNPRDGILECLTASKESPLPELVIVALIKLVESHDNEITSLILQFVQETQPRKVLLKMLESEHVRERRSALKSIPEDWDFSEEFAFIAHMDGDESVRDCARDNLNRSNRLGGKNQIPRHHHVFI